MGLLVFLLLMVALPIGIIVLLTNIVAFVLWIVTGAFKILFFILKPFKWLLYTILGVSGLVWITSD